MKRLHQAVDDYLALLHSLGFKLLGYGQCLHEFVSFLKTNGSSHITNKLALEYATRHPDEKPALRRCRLCIIRGFASDCSGADPRTEVPPVGLLRFRSQRARPYLYSEEEICRLLEAALKMKSLHQLRPHTCFCLFGLLAVSGLRLGEAINLQPQDVNCSEGVLTIRGAKFGKSRLVPLHPSTCAGLRDYPLPAFARVHGTACANSPLRSRARRLAMRK